MTTGPPETGAVRWSAARAGSAAARAVDANVRSDSGSAGCLLGGAGRDLTPN